MKHIIRVFSLAAFAAASFASGLPATPRGDAVDTIEGIAVADPYRWLEDWSDPKVQAWSSQENAVTRATLDALPAGKPIRAELAKLVKSTSPSYSGFVARGARVFAVYSDPKFQQPMIVALNAAANPTSRKIVLDPNALDKTGHTEFDWFVPSADGSKIAVSLSRNGSEDGTLHVYDVTSGREIETPIPDVQHATAGGSLAWAGAGFFYTRYPGEDASADTRHFNMQVYFHKLGSDWKADPLVLGKNDGLEKVSEVFLDNRFNLPAVLAMVQRGDGGIWAFYVLKADAPPLKLGDYADDVVYASFGPDGAIYAISRKDAPNGKIVKLDAPGGLAAAKVIVPESDAAIQTGGAYYMNPDLAFAGGRILVRDEVGGPNQVRVFGLDGAPKGKLPLPEIASNSEIVPLKSGKVLFDVSSYLRPRYFALWDPKTGKMAQTAIKVTSPVHFADAVVTRVFAVSKDGTRIPVNIVMKRGTVLDGRNPALLYGYGGFGISESPYFLGSTARIWLDAGGLYAIANIRGGAEYGERWHRQGMLTHKQNVFDDFAAAADYLVAQRYTSHDRLALLGGSNGGLLMGAEITQHPGLARAVVSAVGIYDMIRVELDPNGSFNTTEYGTVKDPEQFKALYAYSPYHHVVAGTKYPAVLFMTGATDGRVNPMQSRKFAAALQAATSSGLPILLRTSMNSGHGFGTSLDDRIAQQSDEMSFLLDQLGMTFVPMR
jgi:prolyl oligopeptidase